MTPKPWKHLPHESGMRWLPPRLNLPFQQKNQNENERRSVIALVYCAELLVPPKRKKETAGLLHLPHNEAHSQNIWRGNWAMNYFASEPLNDTDSDVVIYYPPPFAAIYPRNDNLTEKCSCFMRSEKSYVLKATCFFFFNQLWEGWASESTLWHCDFSLCKSHIAESDLCAPSFPEEKKINEFHIN